jgi:hypothetical protein
MHVDVRVDVFQDKGSIPFASTRRHLIEGEYGESRRDSAGGVKAHLSVREIRRPCSICRPERGVESCRSLYYPLHYPLKGEGQ